MAQDGGADEQIRALELNLRHVSTPEIEVHHQRGACPNEHANDRWAKIERVHAVEERAFTALHHCHFPPSRANNGMDNTHRPPCGGVLQHTQPKQRPRPLDLINDRSLRQNLGPRHGQRGYFEFEVTDHEKRVARMGLGGQKAHGESATPPTTLSRPIPVPTNHHVPRLFIPKEKPARQMQEESKAQQGETPACGQRVRESTNDALSNARVRQVEVQQKLAQQECEQQRVQLPAAKPGNLYQGPSRISGILPPIRTVRHDDMEQSIISELALSVHIKSKMASQEAYRKYKKKERKKEEKQLKAALSAPRSEATRTESVKQLRASVKKALEDKVEAVVVETVRIEGVETEAFRARPQQPYKSPEDACKFNVKGEEGRWFKHDKNHSIIRQSDGMHCSPNADSASVQPPIASRDHPTGADKSACDIGIAQGEVPLDATRISDLRAAVEAIDKTSGDLLESPKTASNPDEAPLLAPSTVSISPDRKKEAVDAASISPVIDNDPSIKAPRQAVSPLPISHAEQIDMSSELREDEERFDVAEDAARLGNADIRLEWEEIDDGFGDDGFGDDGFGDDGFGDDGFGDDGFGDDGWSDVGDDFGGDVWAGSLSSVGVE